MRKLFFILLAGLALGLVGCASDDDESTATVEGNTIVKNLTNYEIIFSFYENDSLCETMLFFGSGSMGTDLESGVAYTVGVKVDSESNYTMYDGEIYAGATISVSGSAGNWSISVD